MGKYFQFNRLLVLFLGVGLLVLAFEIYLQHYQAVEEKAIAWTPIVFGATGGLLLLFVYLIFNRISYLLFCVIMTCSIGVGLLGLYLHNTWRFSKFSACIFEGKSFDFEVLTSFTPLLAPSAFIAMGSLGILVAIYFNWSNDN